MDKFYDKWDDLKWMIRGTPSRWRNKILRRYFDIVQCAMCEKFYNIDEFETHGICNVALK